MFGGVFWGGIYIESYGPVPLPSTTTAHVGSKGFREPHFSADAISGLFQDFARNTGIHLDGSADKT
jgi:hypothetical protein